jgi:cardiolipin synthase
LPRVNGSVAIVEALFAALDRAERYILTQFYIVRDDAIGQAYAERLVAAARRGVRVCFLYDGIGSWRLSRHYRRRLAEAGVEVGSFTGPRSWMKKLRLNFRNHRKITIVDGREAFVGGLNVGDEYLGREEKFGAWRDTHLHLRGPAVQGLQISFVRDWYFATRRTVEAEWTPVPAEADQRALVLASGPADEVEICGLLYAHAIESAQRRVWIATPYIVPDGRVLGALQLAALRGVDVRVLMPRTSDSLLFKYVPYAFFDDVKPVGVKVHLYEPGFMHQKVALVDDEYGLVGTANFDNRSFRLNFEATVVVRERAFCREIEHMLEADFARATELTADVLDGKPWTFRFASQATHLLAPML